VDSMEMTEGSWDPNDNIFDRINDRIK